MMDPKTSPSDGGLVVFPPELFRPIIQHLSGKDRKGRRALCAISLACRMLQHEGQRQLYRKMTFSWHTELAILIKFLKCIVDNNRLALLVREYTQEGIADHRMGLLWGYLSRGLQAMVNLKVLKFFACHGGPSAEILRGCTFQLRSLVWESRDDANYLSEFLLSHHNLRGLGLAWADYKRELIPPTCCPQLRVLCGNLGAMETFLPGREITSLDWMPLLPFILKSSHIIHSLEHLLPYLSRIRFLSFGEYYPSPSISSIIGFFLCVEVLRFKLPDVDSHEELLAKFSMLHHLKELQVLVISSISGRAPIPADSNDRRPQTMSSIFESCENLKQIDLLLGESNLYQTYRWTAGLLDVQSTLTPHEEVHRWWGI